MYITADFRIIGISAEDDRGENYRIQTDGAANYGWFVTSPRMRRELGLPADPSSLLGADIRLRFASVLRDRNEDDLFVNNPTQVRTTGFSRDPQRPHRHMTKGWVELFSTDRAMFHLRLSQHQFRQSMALPPGTTFILSIVEDEDEEAPP